MEWLLALFGGKAAYVAGAVLVMLAIMLVCAFRQGRTIEFWPPKIGSRPERAGDRPPAVAGPAGPAGSTFPLSAPVTEQGRVFDVSDAAQFYQVIAPNYDQGNSARLLATHMEVITRVDQARRSNPALRVLDLGGGTGRNVATYFFNDQQISWTYVDKCPAMISELQRHLEGRRLYEHLAVHLDDINRIHLRLPAQSFDVILLNLVLSSMPRFPDFTRLAALLAAGGRLIVADINPAYTSAHPYYRAMAADGTPVAMHTRPVQPLEVATQAKGAGLRLGEMTQVGAEEISYSFILSFVKGAQLGLIRRTGAGRRRSGGPFPGPGPGRGGGR
jgi:ubiquinone/menaquinone biosynthesis C-methylase UbiE